MAEQIEQDYEIDHQSFNYCRRLIERYPEEFGFIASEDILVVRNMVVGHSRYYAATSRIHKFLWPVMDYKILIKTNQCNYGLLPENAQILVMYHELKHIVEGEPYKLIYHTVEDHDFMVGTFGMHWALREDLPNILEEAINEFVPTR